MSLIDIEPYCITGGRKVTLLRMDKASFEHAKDILKGIVSTPTFYTINDNGDVEILPDYNKHEFEVRYYMPLKKGKSRATIGSNIKEMEAAGHSKAQSIAASLNEARKSGVKIPKKKKK
jgi:hypothetical protein